MRLPALLLPLALAAGPALATSPSHELLIAPDAGEPWIARPSGSGVSIGRTDGASRRVSLPEGTQLAGLLALRSGWLLQGVIPNAGGSELVLVRGSGALERRLPVPEERLGAWRLSPVAVAVGGRLRALLWLEGDRRDALAVRSARWSGSRWLPAVTVSPAGPGSQLALSVTALADGELLAVWSAFDGEDDEILWSRSRQDAWTAPARLTTDNRVPDITPRVTALPAGAMAAWSRFGDDGYELHTARFAAGAWSAEVRSAGDGALFPTFERAATELALLFRRAGRPGWEAWRLDSEGRPVARATVEDRRGERPVLTAWTGTGLVFRWTDGTSEAVWSPLLTER